MELPQLSLDTFVAICLVIATPWLYQTFAPSSRTGKEKLISSAILLHTIYMLHSLFVSPPQNIFKSLDLDLTTSPDLMRSKLAESFGSEEHIPPHLNTLLKRLGLMDMRTLYIRFGHYVLTTCSYCQTFNDFALYGLPSALLEYIAEIAFVGLLTLPKSSTSHFRPLGLGALLGALMAEAYWVLTVPVLIPPRGSEIPVIMASSSAQSTKLTFTHVGSPPTQWHDNFVQLRHALFLLLPLLLILLPHLALHRIPLLGAFIPAPDAGAGTNLPPARFQMQGQASSLPPDVTLSQISNMTLKTLGHLVPTLHLLKYSHAAIMRSNANNANANANDNGPTTETLYSRASEWWRQEAHEGTVVRSDEGVRKILKSTGFSLDEEKKDGETVVQPEGQLLNSAKLAVNMLKEQGGPPSEHWIFQNN